MDQSESMLVKGAQVINCSSVSKQCDLYRSNHFWEWHQTRAISIFLRLHWVHRGFSQLMNVRTWHRLLSVRKQNSWEYVLRILCWGCFRAFLSQIICIHLQLYISCVMPPVYDRNLLTDPNKMCVTVFNCICISSEWVSERLNFTAFLGTADKRSI